MSADVFRKAADVIRVGGLTKGCYNNGVKHCTVGALRVAACGYWNQVVPEVYDAEDAVADVVREQYPDRAAVTAVLTGAPLAPFVVVTTFNDHPDTTADDVVMVLEKAALRAEEVVL